MSEHTGRKVIASCGSRRVIEEATVTCVHGVALTTKCPVCVLEWCACLVSDAKEALYDVPKEKKLEWQIAGFRERLGDLFSDLSHLVLRARGDE